MDLHYLAEKALTMLKKAIWEHHNLSAAKHMPASAASPRFSVRYLHTKVCRFPIPLSPEPGFTGSIDVWTIVVRDIVPDAGSIYVRTQLVSNLN